MKLDINPDWLLQMAEKEDGKCISVGGYFYGDADTNTPDAETAVQAALRKQTEATEAFTQAVRNGARPLPSATDCDRNPLACRNPQSLRYLPLSDTVTRSEWEAGRSTARCLVVALLWAAIGIVAVAVYGFWPR